MRKKIILIILAAFPLFSMAQGNMYSRNDSLFRWNPESQLFEFVRKSIPAIAGQSGKVLSNNGTDYTWTVPATGISQGTLDDSTAALRTSINGKAAASHLHPMGEVTDLQTTLDGKASTSHNHNPTAGQGLGGTVTQNANKTTAVTINKQSGQITMNNAALAAGAEVTFTVNNSTVASTDVPIVVVQSVGTAGAYLVTVGSVSNGAFTITVSNASAGSLSQAVVLSFAIIKAVNN